MGSIKCIIHKELNVSIEWDSLTEPVKDYFILYGIKQSLADAGASGKTTEEKIALSQKRLDKIKSGIVPTGGGSRLSAYDKKLREVVISLLAKKGIKAKESKNMVKNMKEVYEFMQWTPEQIEKLESHVTRLIENDTGFSLD